MEWYFCIVSCHFSCSLDDTQFYDVDPGATFQATKKKTRNSFNTLLH